ncbi:hypothetical protein SKAU_G00089330 [Synaphobranchus kaupii]|uniref:Uncharacterized protein n=1 Tax=Synaphobranchus kaupii TaxID=118154 RepID=A0A9Q1FX84_SYNKA|nr:hypothetical protein SKAU_G00089330 [Synaphobranchus kaupii]
MRRSGSFQAPRGISLEPPCSPWGRRGIRQCARRLGGAIFEGTYGPVHKGAPSVNGASLVHTGTRGVKLAAPEKLLGATSARARLPPWRKRGVS